MNTVQARLPSWVGVCNVELAPWSARAPIKPAGEIPLKGFQFTAEESARFLRIVAECGRIRGHYDLYRWLAGEVQQFLPHEVLLSAWGDFASWDLKLDVTSGLPGVRTAQLAYCRVDPIIRHAHARWIDGGRTAVLLKPADLEPEQDCHCAIHAALRKMHSVLVHGVHDKRSGRDSLFIALGAGPFAKGRSLPRFLASTDALVAQIDAAFRKVPALPIVAAGSALRESVLDLSMRELEVLESICKGKTNLDIAAALDISPFTVKNHVQRIFRKIGVTNRTQAAARYADAMRDAAAGPGQEQRTAQSNVI
ncbi:MAG TPA: XrtB/PEP-CTERM-associated transcriptional regulator EpsA [Burkholderiales bacterium]|nr:XrtB/PEP-CTERM-associated transcriptional regulator EpsA [Burkholderiales bacterium]